MSFPEHTVLCSTVLSHPLYVLTSREGTNPGHIKQNSLLSPCSLWILIWAFLKLVFSFFLIHFYFWYVWALRMVCAVFRCPLACSPVAPAPRCAGSAVLCASRVPAQAGRVALLALLERGSTCVLHMYLCACVAGVLRNARQVPGCIPNPPVLRLLALS